MEHERVLSLDFGRFMLSLDSRPEAPGLSFPEDRVKVPPRNPSWEHHLKGATVTAASQSGMDRVLVLEFERSTVYDHGPCTLHFEMTGRNANIVLCRKTDGRIIACIRRVSSHQNRYRTISPGGIYTPPPPSGLPPEKWHETALPPDPSPMDLCRALEGVGPATARAILDRAGAIGSDIAGVLNALSEDLARENIPDWIGGQPGPSRAVEAKAPGAAELTARLTHERKELTRKLAASEQALESLERPETFRMWGSLIHIQKRPYKGSGTSPPERLQRKRRRDPPQKSPEPSRERGTFLQKGRRCPYGKGKARRTHTPDHGQAERA